MGKHGICKKKINNIKFTANASSELEPQSGVYYSVNNLIDNNEATCWTEGVNGDGIGEKVTIVCNGIATINRIIIHNGYCKSEKLFYENNRVKKIKITFDNGESVIADLSENFSDRVTVIPVSTVQTSAITFEIMEVYKGSKYDDTCISEIVFA